MGEIWMLWAIKFMAVCLVIIQLKLIITSICLLLTLLGGVCLMLLGLIWSFYHELYETCHSVTFYFMKKTPNSAVTPQRQSQFTPKMKANAVPLLLSSLVWIDQYNECNGMKSFMEFMEYEFCQRDFNWELMQGEIVHLTSLYH